MVAETWGTDAVASRKASQRNWIEAAAEAQQGRAMLWAPVALTIGIWGYFGLASEPSWIFLTPLAAAGVLLFWVSRSRPALALAALVILGCVLAKAKVDFVAAPVLHATTAERLLSGTVEDRSPCGRGRQVIILGVDGIEGMPASALPRRLRLMGSLKQGEAPLVGVLP